MIAPSGTTFINIVPEHAGMKSFIDAFKKTNKSICSVDSITRGFCAPSLKQKGTINYIGLVLFAWFAQYIVPALVILLAIPVFVGNVVAIAGISFLSAMNPFILLALIPVVAFDAGYVAIFVVASFVVTIVYWAYYIREIGILGAVAPLSVVLSLVVSMIPYAGSFLSTVINITPWMAGAVILHWFLYRE